MNFWTELKLRLKGDTPAFFLKLRRIALYWAGGFGAAYGLLKTHTIDLPDKHEVVITDAITYIVLALVIVSGGTFLPTLNKSVLQQQLKEEIKSDTIEKTKEVIADKMSEKVTDISTQDIKKEIDKKE